MLRKAKSIYVIIGMTMAMMLAFVVGTYQNKQAAIKEFEQDGFTLGQGVEASLDGVIETEQIWFGEGGRWSANGEKVSFTDAQGNLIQLGEDIFLHYNDGAISTLCNTAVVDLDSYAAGVISQYGMGTGESLRNMGAGIYSVGNEDLDISFTNFLLKNSEKKYLIGSPRIRLEIPGQPAIDFTDGFAELNYQAEDKSILTMQDRERNITFVTKGATITLENGVSFNLEKGTIQPSSYQLGVSQTGTFVTLDGIDITAVAQAMLPGSQFSTYRFHISDGIDGEEGKAGEDGEDGEDGEEGAEGAEGAAGSEGEEGAAGSAGKKGGSLGTNTDTPTNGLTVPGITLVSRVPVVRFTDWKVNGPGLMFTLNMDETSYENINPESTYIELIDLTEGERVICWNSGQEYEYDDEKLAEQTVDLSDERDEGHTITANVLKAGHQYRLWVSVGYTLEDTSGTQEVLSRTFTADDYGVIVAKTATSSNGAQYEIYQDYANEGGKKGFFLSDVKYSVDDGETYHPTTKDGDKFIIDDMSNLDLKSGTDYNIKFHCTIIEQHYDDQGGQEEVAQEIDAYYDSSFTTLKKSPKVGGIKMTAYGSGHFMVEVLGEYDNTEKRYLEVQDDDDAIEALIFELATDQSFTNIVATEQVSETYSAFFEVKEPTSGHPVQTGQTYYVRAKYAKNDGATVMTVPVLETQNGLNTAGTGAKKGDPAYASASLKQISGMTMSFIGDSGLKYLSTDDTTGITHNQIRGNIQAILSNSNYVISKDYPVELQISAMPGYYQSYTYLDKATSGSVTVLKPDVPLSTTPQPLSDNVQMSVDLSGLKADTNYMFTMYGYEKRGEKYNRVVMGAMSLSTREVNEEIIQNQNGQDVKVTRDYLMIDLVGDGNSIGIGCYPVLGEKTDSQYTNADIIYKNVSGIRFELYRQANASTGMPEALIGSCEITDTNADVSSSTIFDQFYGARAAQTHITSPKLVGVGSTYQYPFRNSSNQIIEMAGLTNGTYEIRATAVYDYTYARYKKAISGEAVYDYYTYRGKEADYVNQLVSTYAVSDPFTVQEIPYVVPEELKYSDINSYVKTAMLTNEELARYVFNDRFYNELGEGKIPLYDTDLLEDTVVGVKLNNQYVVDANAMTDQLIYYGIENAKYNAIDANANPFEDETLVNFKCTVPLQASAEGIKMNMPEVWIVSCEATTEGELTTLQDDLKNVNTDNRFNSANVLFWQELTVEGKPVYVFYVQGTGFRRGLSYRFAYETCLPNYAPAGVTLTNNEFIFPRDYYQLAQLPYTKTTMLSSLEISLEKQKPIIYSSLQSTEKKAADGVGLRDYWNVYVDDPDNAIEWKSMLRASVPGILTGSTTNSGLRDFGRNTFTTEIPRVRFKNILSGDTENERDLVLNSKTVYNSSVSANSFSDDDLTLIRNAFTKKPTQGGEIYGGEIQVQLPYNGTSLEYQLALDYRLVEDNASYLWTGIHMISHKFEGLKTSADYVTDLDYVVEGLGADHNTVTIYLQPKQVKDDNGVLIPVPAKTDADYYLSDEYMDSIRSVAGIKLSALVSQGGTGAETRVYERDTTTGKPISSRPKYLWLPLTPAATDGTDFRYCIRFTLNDLDSVAGSSGQIRPSDKLRFEFEVNYVPGYSNDETSQTLGGRPRAVKYINRSEAVPAMNGSAIAVDNPEYLYVSRGYDISAINAGRSMNVITGNAGVDATTLPWQQKLTIEPVNFESGSSNALNNYTVGLDTRDAFRLGADDSNNESRAVELLPTLSTTILRDKVIYKTAGGDGTDSLLVLSAVPTLRNVKKIQGLSSIEIEADVSNYTLIQYPGTENLAFYYLVYKLDGSGTEQFYGYIKDTNAHTGKLKLALAPLDKGEKYVIKPYYKRPVENEQFLTDELMFSNNYGYTLANPPEAGVFYENTGSNPVAEAVRKMILENSYTKNQFEALVVENAGLISYKIDAETGKGIEISNVTLRLNETSGYAEKRIEIEANITSDIIGSDKNNLKLFYFIERCQIGADETNPDNWKTVIADSKHGEVAGYAVTNWDSVVGFGSASGPHYWEYYGSDYQLSSSEVNKNINSVTMPYYAGGYIVPGYKYRARVAVALKQEGTISTMDNVCLHGGIASTGVYSASVAWDTLNNSDLYAYVTTMTQSRQSDGFTISASVKDSSGTALTRQFYTRLAKVNDDGSLTILEDRSVQDENKYSSIDFAYEMYDRGNLKAHRLVYQNLEPNSTYRVLFYAVADPEYDNAMNYTRSDLSAGSIEFMTENAAEGTGADAWDTRLLKTSEYYAVNATGEPQNNLEILKRQFLGYQEPEKQLFFAPMDMDQSDENIEIGSILVGYSNEITTLADANTFPGELQSVRISAYNDENVPTELEFSFSDAYNASAIGEIEVQIGTADGTAITWDGATTIKKEENPSLFEGGTDGDQSTGNLTLKFSLEGQLIEGAIVEPGEEPPRENVITLLPGVLYTIDLRHKKPAENGQYETFHVSSINLKY